MARNDTSPGIARVRQDLRLADDIEESLLPERSRGLERCADFASRAGRAYARSRNYDFGPDRRDNVSCLSPYLRHRLVQEEEILTEALRRHGRSGAEKFIDEVFWRAYFKGWLEHRPSVWHDYRRAIALLAATLETDSGLRDRYVRALSGETGIDCFDAWTHELIQTGYLHNHARMWFASIWIFTLELPWQLGADFFLRHLLDGDPASNTLSWRWVGGLHTKGKTYIARADNIRKFTDGRFDPSGRLAADAPALKEPGEHALSDLAGAVSWPAAPSWGLLITEDDCCPEHMNIDHAPIAVVGLTCTDDRSPFELGIHAQTFAAGAVQDALSRSNRRWNLEGCSAAPRDWSQYLIEFAGKHDIDVIATPYAPTGPVADRLAAAREALAVQGIELVSVRRQYDSVAWPHAKQGFFRLKKRIPTILSSLGLA